MDEKQRITTINVDQEVRDVLNALRQKRPGRRAGVETANDVLRRVLGLSEADGS